MVSKKLPYDTNGLPYDVYMGDSRPQCCTAYCKAKYQKGDGNKLDANISRQVE